jgi:hypothetical protein
MLYLAKGKNSPVLHASAKPSFVFIKTMLQLGASASARCSTSHTSAFFVVMSGTMSSTDLPVESAIRQKKKAEIIRLPAAWAVSAVGLQLRVRFVPAALLAMLRTALPTPVCFWS